MITIALLLAVKVATTLAEKKEPEIYIYHTTEGEKALWL
ncbi:hypothetical protein LI17339_13845 [Bacillus licheniformis LMG 17339]|nr:hypothetical protein LI17339_13845 [Bacillus licheniformis LMG 17339]